MNINTIHSLFLECTKVSTDTRKIEKDCLFVALKGDNFDANTFAKEALDKGAKFVIIDNNEYYIDEKTILVNDSLETLQQLAKFHRTYLGLPIIALTGSNGKTTTKELIHAVLCKKYNTIATIGNLNNHIGVPLTLLRFTKDTEIGIVEMGANHQKEIEFLCTIAQPNFGYITNFGKAHLEGFGGVEGVIKGKSELYDYLKSNNQFVIVNENDPIQVEKTEGYDLVIPFGRRDSEFYFEKFTENNCVGIIYNDVEALSKLTGDYNFTNLCAATSLGLYFGIDFNLIKKAIEEYTPTNMRSQIVKKGDKTLVLDTYNANPSSMKVSLENFNDFIGTKTIIIGDMLELGEESAAEHSQILELAKSLNFDEIITVGPHFKEVNASGIAFLTTQDLINYLTENDIHSQNILLKASRGIALEKALEFIK